MKLSVTFTLALAICGTAPCVCANDSVCSADTQTPSNITLRETLNPSHCSFIGPEAAQHLTQAKRFALAHASSAANESRLAVRSWPQIADALGLQQTVVVYALGFNDFVERQQCQRTVKSAQVKIVRGGLHTLIAQKLATPTAITLNDAVLYASRNAKLIGPAQDAVFQQLSQQHSNVTLIKSAKDLPQSDADNLFIIGDFAWPDAIPSHWYHIQADSRALAAALAQNKTSLSEIGKPLKRPCYLQ